MFERYTERARQVVVLAQEEARELRHDYIGTEHLLLGLLREEEGLAARVLEDEALLVEDARTQVVKIVGQSENPARAGQIPFTPRAKIVMEKALREAITLGHNYVGTEHILLSLLNEPDGVGGRVMLDLLGEGYADRIRYKVVNLLSGPSVLPHEPPPPPAILREGLSYEDVREGVGRLHVRHRNHFWMEGILVAYEWDSDRCAVSLSTAASEVLGVDKIRPKRENLVKLD